MQGYNIIAENTNESKPTVERLTAEELRKLTPTERIEYAKKLNGRQPKTANCLILDKSTADKINTEKRSQVNESTDKKPGKKSKKAKTDKEEKAVETVNSFTKALTEFEVLMIDILNGTINDKEYNRITISIAKAITFSIIKKLIQVATKTPKEGTKYNEISYDKTMENIKNSLIFDFIRLDEIEYSVNNGTYAKLDKNGKIQLEVSDSALNKAIDDNLKDSLSEGMSIVHEVVSALLEEVKKADNFSVGYFTNTITDRKLKNGKVYAKNGKKKIEWVAYEITPLQRVYRKVRAYIQSNKAIKSVINGYLYLEGTSIDDESGNIEQIFYRLKKYDSLCERIVDFNGKEYALITSTEVVEEWDKVLADFIAKTNIDQKYIDLIEMRKDNKSLNDISISIGISSKTVERMITSLKDIAVKNGYGDESMLIKISNDEKSKSIECWKYTDFNAFKDYYIPIQYLESQKISSDENELLTEEDKKKNAELDEKIKSLKAELKKYKPLTVVKSLRKAEEFSSISQSTIRRVLKGETSSSKGYYFRYVDSEIIKEFK